MAIIVRCTCGKKLQVADNAAGTKIRCGACKEVLTVPQPEAVTAVPAVPAVPAEPAPRRSKRPKPAKGASKVWLLALLGVAAVLLLGCLGVGGFAVYYFALSGKSSAESTLVGEWEIDPDSTPIIIFPIRITFNKEHTYRMQAGFEFDGTWQVTSRDGSKLHLTMTTNFMGMKSDRSSHPTVTIIDKDHIQLDSDDPGMQSSNMRFRRVGSGGRPVAGPNPDANIDPKAPGLGDRGKMNPNLDKGMVADCEVEWAGAWYEAKILKTEKDRWFIHYLGWPSNWDEWVTKERIRLKK